MMPVVVTTSVVLFSILYTSVHSNKNHVFTIYASPLVPSEKMTDVNIAVEMMSDAYQDLFDVAILTSADCDLTAPVLAIKKLFPDKRVIVAFPPQRHSAQLERLAHGSFQIGTAIIARSVFPEKVQKADGFVLRKPHEWK